MNKLLKNLLLTLVVGVFAFITGNYFYGSFQFENSLELFIDLGMNILYSFISYLNI